MAIDFSYKPDGEVLKTFMKDNTFFRGIRGPVGSGKSVGCCVEVFRRALEQKKSQYETQTHSYELQLLKHGLIGFPKTNGENLTGQSHIPIELKKAK